MSTDYDNLARLAEAGELRVKPATVRRGPEAAAEAEGQLKDATGARNREELTHLALGRPSLGSTSGASPVVRARVPQELKDRVTEIAQRENRKESDIVRAALAAYVELSA